MRQSGGHCGDQMKSVYKLSGKTTVGVSLGQISLCAPYFYGAFFPVLIDIAL